MDYFSVSFAIFLGLLFALMAYNKTGEVFPPFIGGFISVFFWLLFNELGGNVYNGILEASWYNPALWLEACISSLIGAVVGIENTYDSKTKEKGIYRGFVPLVLFFISIVLML